MCYFKQVKIVRHSVKTQKNVNIYSNIIVHASTVSNRLQ